MFIADTCKFAEMPTIVRHRAENSTVPPLRHDHGAHGRKISNFGCLICYIDT